jgi:hypothetical protein
MEQLFTWLLRSRYAHMRRRFPVRENDDRVSLSRRNRVAPTVRVQRPLRPAPTRVANDLNPCLTVSPSVFAVEIAALPEAFADCFASVALFSAALRCLVAAPFFAAACRSAFVRSAMLLSPSS